MKNRENVSSECFRWFPGFRFSGFEVRFVARSTGENLNAPAGDDGIVGGPRTPQQIAAQKRLQQTQAQVDEVVDIMKTNVEKVLERDQKLSELDDRAGESLKISLTAIFTSSHCFSL